LPALANIASIYADQDLALWLILFVLGAAAIWFNRGRNRIVDVVGALVICAPFLSAAASLWLDDDLADQTGKLLAVWPFVLIIGLLSLACRRRWPLDVTFILPFIIFATAQGAFLSQQLWGSTYAIWPLLSILLACVLGPMTQFLKSSAWIGISVAIILSGSLTLAGGAYARSHSRLDYALMDEGSLYRARAPLQGLSLRGEQLPDFEQLLAYAGENIPRNDPILLIPGEDPFYFATGRRPQFPVLLFDHSTNPFEADELVRLCIDRRIRWLIVKRKLQLLGDPVEHREQLMGALMRLYTPVARLRNYDIYELRPVERSQP
jgi:hypothetical protein